MKTWGFMQRLLTFAILLVSTLALHAQGQQPNVAKLKKGAQGRVEGRLAEPLAGS
jgi:hypothetical protein